MNKEHFTHHPTVPMDVRGRSVSEITHAMTETRFQGRKLGESVEVWVRMLQGDEVTIMMGLSGAVVPAGMRGIITFLIQHRSMDCLVSTGRRRGHEIMVYQIKDADEIMQIVEQFTKTGVVYVGGGVPKNFIQQTEVIASMMGGDE